VCDKESNTDMLTDTVRLQDMKGIDKNGKPTKEAVHLEVNDDKDIRGQPILCSKMRLMVDQLNFYIQRIIGKEIYMCVCVVIG